MSVCMYYSSVTDISAGNRNERNSTLAQLFNNHLVFFIP